MSPTANRFSLLKFHVAVVLAGGTGLFPKLVGASPALIVCARTLFGCLALALVSRFVGASLRLAWRDLAGLAGAGALLAVHWFAFFQSIRISTVAMGVLGICSFPIFALFLEPLFFRERFRASAVVAVFLVVAGLLLVAPDFDGRNPHALGLLWAVFSGMVYAVFSLISRRAVRSLPSLTTSFYQQVFAGLVALPFAVSGLDALTGVDVAWLVVLGVIFTALAQWLINSGLRHQSVQTLSVLLALEPLYAILLAWLFIGEVPAARTLLGGAIICATVVWVSTRGRHSADG